MLPLRARVTNGHLVLDEPTTLPEGTEVELVVIEDELDAPRRGLAILGCRSLQVRISPRSR